MSKLTEILDNSTVALVMAGGVGAVMSYIVSTFRDHRKTHENAQQFKTLDKKFDEFAKDHKEDVLRHRQETKDQGERLARMEGTLDQLDKRVVGMCGRDSGGKD